MFWPRVTSLFRSLTRRSQVERDMTDEAVHHLEARAGDLMKQSGIDREAALRQARLEFGSFEKYREEARQSVGVRWIDELRADGRYALRQLKTPSYTITGLLTIGLTVGGIATVFAFIDSILLNPLPFPESHRLVRLTQPNPMFPELSRGLSYPDYRDMRGASRSFDAVAAFSSLMYAVDEDTEPFIFVRRRTTPELFSMLEVAPHLGRLLVPADEDVASPPVTVIEHEFWQLRMGGRPDAVGQSVRLDPNDSEGSLEYTVVGVLPPEFEVPFGVQFAIASGGIWTPVRRDAVDLVDRGAGSWTTIARLRDEVSAEEAQTEIDTISARLAAEYPATNADRQTEVTRVLDAVVGDTGQTIWIFFGAVSLLLLIGTANLTSLQMARNSVPAREIQVRAALGAGRFRLIRQLLVESLILCGAGGVLGGLLAYWGTQFVANRIPVRVPRLDEVAFDANSLVFVLGVSVAVGVWFGLVPALSVLAAKSRIISAAGTARTMTMDPARMAVQKTMIGLEAGLSVLLLVGALLLTNSFWRVYTEDAGLAEDGLGMVSIRLPRTFEAPEVEAFMETALRRVRSLDAVESAAAAMGGGPLMGGSIGSSRFVPEGRTADTFQPVPLNMHRVSGDYFRTLGVSVRGSWALETDLYGQEPVAVLNRTAARMFWPSEDALGKLLIFDQQALAVVGIVDDFKDSSLAAEVSPQI